jgi:hypothetical protein
MYASTTSNSEKFLTAVILLSLAGKASFSSLKPQRIPCNESRPVWLYESAYLFGMTCEGPDANKGRASLAIVAPFIFALIGRM